MGFTMGMGLNLLLLLAMVATNMLSLYHLSSSLQSHTPAPTSQQVPSHLIHQLNTIRATINHLTRVHPSPPSSTTPTTPPPDLLLLSHLSPIPSSCHHYPHMLYTYMNYTPFSLCPPDSDNLAESLILRGCHPLPRRRCFSSTPQKFPSSLPSNPFALNLPSSTINWEKYSCKNFDCLNKLNTYLGFDNKIESSRFTGYKSELDLPISQLIQISKTQNSILRLAIDVGGGTGTFAAHMKSYNVTVITTTMNLGAPYNEMIALRGLIPLHTPLQQRFPIFDGVVDLVRCGHAVNRWIPVTVMEFLFYDVDRVLRGGGHFWLDRFFSKGSDLERVYGPLIQKLGYRKVKWATADKTDSSGLKNGEVYLTALLQKPMTRSSI
ncbi:putative S-adenosyl-L-methionine-dependent methyltransferase [Dillenia turbinata]|uniref:S-adenosyl-L-methionine-dependent methyltransferase n=1 Tax=Dillenia turbinata TaxID=194707 RepID=A0AAN8VQX0_9MAGN